MASSRVRKPEFYGGWEFVVYILQHGEERQEGAVLGMREPWRAGTPAATSTTNWCSVLPLSIAADPDKNVKADILWAPGAVLFRSIIHSCGICIKIESTGFDYSTWSLPIQCQASKTNKVCRPFLGTKHFSRRWQISKKAPKEQILWLPCISTHCASDFFLPLPTRTYLFIKYSP